MVIHGHIENGAIVPHGGISLPDGTQVTIIAQEKARNDRDMSADQRKKYLDALMRIDAIANENPGDSFGGADHDRALYG